MPYKSVYSHLQLGQVNKPLKDIYTSVVNVSVECACDHMKCHIFIGDKFCLKPAQH